MDFVSALVPMLLLNVSAEFRELILSPNSPAGRIARLGLSLSAVTSAFLYCFFQSSLAEEILFRGLLGKRLMKWLGYKIGNTLQAAVFAMLHLAILQLVLKTSAPALQAFSVLATFALGYFFGCYNQKNAGGSIVPAVLMHGLGNFLGYLVVLYWTL